MSNGKPWLPEHTATLTRMAGKVPDSVIAEKTGHKAVTVFYRRKALDLPAYRSRKGRLMADAAWVFDDEFAGDDASLCKSKFTE